jgi:hypothetical protein
MRSSPLWRPGGAFKFEKSFQSFHLEDIVYAFVEHIMDNNSSDDEAGRGESMDFCIADTQQVDATSAFARRGSDHRGMSIDWSKV